MDEIWTNTQGTHMDASYSNKIINYKGIFYLAQCLSYRDEIKPKPAEFIFEAVQRRIDRDWFFTRQMLETLMPAMYAPALQAVTADPDNDIDPYWNNGFFSWGDARVAYAMVTTFKPQNIVEIGCGNSTKWFRRAIRDAGLATVLTSIDPMPRTEIAGIPDEVVRSSVVDVDLAVFDRLRAGDVLFWDGSHICFNGSDVCTLFLEVLPRLPAGVLLQIHDISLPFAGFDSFKDVSEDLCTHTQSEQLMLATYLLNAMGAKVVMPNFYLWTQKQMPDYGNSFWVVTG